MQLNSYSFSRQGETVVACTTLGFILYDTTQNQPTFTFDREHRQTNFGIHLEGTTLILFCGVRNQRFFSDKSLCVYDYSTRRSILDIEYGEPVLRIIPLRRMFAVCFASEIRVYKFDPIGLFIQLRCNPNELAPCDFCDRNDSYVVAYGGPAPGQMTIKAIETSGGHERIISAASHQLSMIRFNPNGSTIATASVQGTLIRIYNSDTGDCIHELRRGSFSATIQSIAFTAANDKLAVTSSKGTLHIFSLSSDQESVKRSTLTWKMPPANTSTVVSTANNVFLVANSNGQIFQLAINELGTVAPESEKTFFP